MKQKIIELAQAEGADLLSVAPVVAYDEYLESVRERMRETDADHTDFMVPKNHPSFFKDLSNIKRIFPEAKSIVLLGVYAMDTQNGHSDSFAKRCNGDLKAISKQSIWDILEPLTKKHFNTFKLCSDCGKIFWQGSHHKQLRQLVDGVR